MFTNFEDYKNYGLNETKNTLLNIIFSLLVLKKFSYMMNHIYLS